MKKIQRSFAIFTFAIILSGLLSVSKTYASTGSCYLQALRSDVYVVLHEMNSDGYKGPKIWEGRIDEGQKVLVTVPHARFRLYYSYQPDKNQPLSGGNDRYCDSRRTVGVP